MAETTHHPHASEHGYAFPHDGGAHGDGHAHDPNLAHHFEDLGQQKSSASLGMWAFLGTEVMFFGGLIVSYIVYRFSSPDVWGAASKDGLNVWLGTINTVVLLTSSLAMAMAVHAGETGVRAHQLRYLLLTLALGSLFIVIKGFEYHEEYKEDLIPGPGFRTHALKHLPGGHGGDAQSGAHPAAGHPTRSAVRGGEAHEARVPDVATGRLPVGEVRVNSTEAKVTAGTASFLTVTPDQFIRQRAQMFFIFYFFMTGLHLLHMVVGLGLVTWIFVLARRGRFTPSYHTPLELTGLYWHFIDIVWVFLYPLLYLVALHK